MSLSYPSWMIKFWWCLTCLPWPNSSFYRLKYSAAFFQLNLKHFWWNSLLSNVLGWPLILRNSSSSLFFQTLLSIVLLILHWIVVLVQEFILFDKCLVFGMILFQLSDTFSPWRKLKLQIKPSEMLITNKGLSISFNILIINEIIGIREFSI